MKMDKKLLIKRLKRQTRKNSSLLNEMILIINEDNITVKNTKEIKEFNSEEILKIQEENNYIYIVSNKHKYIAIIPDNAFSSIEEK